MKEFYAHINKCRKCGQPRIEMCYHVLPEDTKKAFEWIGESGEYLFCSKCKDFSVITDFETGKL